MGHCIRFERHFPSFCPLDRHVFLNRINRACANCNRPSLSVSPLGKPGELLGPSHARRRLFDHDLELPAVADHSNAATIWFFLGLVFRSRLFGYRTPDGNWRVRHMDLVVPELFSVSNCYGQHAVAYPNATARRRPDLHL